MDSSFYRLAPGLAVDLDRCILIRDQEQIDLSAQEVRLLRVLLSVPYKWFPAADLEEILSDSSENPHHAVQVTVSRLRQKMGEEKHKPKILRSKYQFGYRIFPQ